LKRFTKKSQASLEFLLTYGWAFIAIIAVFGVITYMGLSNPERFAPQSCIVGEAFECVDFGAYYGSNVGYIAINLKNTVGHRININQIEVRTFRGADVKCIDNLRVEASNGTDIVNDISVAGPADLLLDPGKSINVSIFCDTGDTLDPGEIFRDDLLKSDFTVRYRINKSGYFDKNIVGSTVVEAGLTP
jgi:hypothetical protein